MAEATTYPIPDFPGLDQLVSPAPASKILHLTFMLVVNDISIYFI